MENESGQEQRCKRAERAKNGTVYQEYQGAGPAREPEEGKAVQEGLGGAVP
jgi:hypothetical protein